MVVLISFTFGLAFWIGAWSFGWKPWDAFMVALLFLVVATGWWIVRPFIQRMLGREPEA